MASHIGVFTVFAILCLVIPSVCSTKFGITRYESKATINSYNVRAYGAIGDGRTDNSQAFIRAWRSACASKSVPVVTIPMGTYLTRPLTFEGPCASKNIHFQVVGTIVQAGYQTVERGSDYFWIRFMFVNGLIIEGSGTLNGNGPYWWSHNCRFNMLDVAACPLPVFYNYSLYTPEIFAGLKYSLHFHGCNGLQLDGLHFKDSARGHISLSNMNGATISNLRISAPGNSRNTDGIDISDSSHIQIRDSFIGTGDDCVAIGGGSSFINISNVLCGPGHGISVGSLGAKGARDTVEEVHVNNCNFTNTMYGLRIKTWQGGSGYARKITFDKIHVNNVGVPIFIDQYYCNGGNNCGISSSAVQVSDVSFRGVTGTSSSQDAIKLSCSRTVGCTNIFMQDINIHPGKASCINAHGRAVRTLPAACLSP